MKILVIGDIHGESIWKKFGDIEQLLQSNIFETEYDKYVFLGDYFDSFKVSSPKILERFHDVLRLKKNYPDKVVLLLGNHDTQYFLWPAHLGNNPYGCSGYRPEYHLTLNEIYLKEQDLFQAAYQVKNYLFTHAGVSEAWYTQVYKMSKQVEEEGYTDMADLINKEFKYRNRSLFAVGFSRGGMYAKSGPFWADKSETILNHTVGLHQIVGHTSLKEIEKHSADSESSITYCDVLQSRYPEPLILEI